MKSAFIPLLFFCSIVGACKGEKQFDPSEPSSLKKDYPTLVKEILAKRDVFKKAYENSDTEGRQLIVDEARDYIFDAITTEIFPQWYGTKWDFYGTTRTPGEGKIACGYFVTNVLTDAGFNIPRVKWAQSASEVFIKKLAPSDITRFSNRPISEVESYLKPKGDGLYLVGLDSHVGFIVVRNGKSSFVHSNYYKADKGVMSEEIDSKNPLSDSAYRVLGKLLSDEMVVNWITGEAYNVE